MTFLVENGTGVQGANALVPVEYVTAYLAERGRSTEGGWDTASTAQRQAFVIAATDYLETRHGGALRGRKEHTFEEVPATATVTITAESTSGDVITIGGVEVPMDHGSDLTVAAAAVAALLYGDDQIDGLAAIVRSATSDGAVVTITAAAYGELGNFVTLADGTDGDVTIVGFAGGLDGGPQAVSFPRTGLYDRHGCAVLGVPRPVRDAVAEYSVRAAVAALLPDPVVHSSGRAVLEQEQKVGPITERYRFEDGSVLSRLLRPYPAADRLIERYTTGGSGVVRW